MKTYKYIVMLMSMQADCSGRESVRSELGARSLGTWLADDRKGEPFNGTYVFRGDSRPDTHFTFTTSHMAAGVGLSYAF